MASLALGLVGAGIGSLALPGFTFLGMSGAGLGWAVGSALGNILFAPDGPNTQGPRLSDLSVQTSTRGAPIPKVYGTSRIAGNVIWTAGIQETATTQDVGGKGGPSASHTTYSYSCSFAVGLCEGPIAGIRRIWADSVLIYNKADSATSDDLSVSDQSDITIYIGTETQDSDPVIEVSEGSGNVPGFRGLAYVVFSDFQLERYGNRIPNITFEVVGEGYYAPISTNQWNTSYDPTVDATFSGPVSYDSGVVTYLEGNSNNLYSFTTDEDGNNLTTPVLEYDGGGVGLPGTMRLVTHHSTSKHKTILWLERNWGDSSNAIKDNLGNKYANGSYSISYVDPVAGNNGPAAYVIGDTMYMVCERNYNLYSNIRGLLIRKIDLTGGATKTASDTVVVTTGLLDPSATIFYDDKNSLLYVSWTSTGDTGEIYEYDESLNQTGYWNTGSTMPYPGDYGGIPYSQHLCVIDRIHYRYILDSTNVAKFWRHALNDDGTYTYLDNADAPPPSNPSTNYDSTVYRMPSGIFISRNATMVLDAISISDVYLADIVEDICADVGISDIDVSSIADTVHGYVRSSQMTARSAIEPLLAAYQCGAVESDYTLKFSALTGTPSETLAYDDLAGEVGIIRDVETELPRRVIVSYSDKDSDYLPAVQKDQRIYSTGQVINEVSVQFAISSDADHMAQVAEKILYRAWTEREKFDWPLTQKYAYLDAGDVVAISSDTASHVVRITNGQMGLPGLIECSGVATRASLYSSSVSGVASSYTSQSLVLVGDTLFEVMDLPALRDADATSAGFYVAVYGERSNWSSGIVYRSTDGGSSWSGLVTTRTEATMGVTTDALGDGDHKTWDEVNTVNISMYNGTLSSDTTDNVLNGANAVLIGDELIHFRTATLEGDGTYTLSGLLRGMKGTEHETGTHAIGDRFVLLNTTSIYRVSSDYSKLNVTDKFKAVTSGQFLDSVTDTTDVTYTNLNAKPLSPCQIYGTRDGSSNLTINWQRRSRLTETSLDDPGLGEATELYEVHVMSGGVAVRVIQSTANSTTYTAAQQTADGLTPGDPVTVNIYQVSDTVGRGYVRSETI